MQNNPSKIISNQLAKKLVALGFRRIELVEFETFVVLNDALILLSGQANPTLRTSGNRWA